VTGWHDDGPRTIILDRGLMRGPTFVAIDTARYLRHEHDSAYVGREWETMKRSSCGGGPLSRPLGLGGGVPAALHAAKPSPDGRHARAWADGDFALRARDDR
jgi:hypothetical protein